MINNAIKHNGGIVTENLEKCGGWKAGDKLTDLGREYERLALEAEKYIAALVDSVKEFQQNCELTT